MELFDAVDVNGVKLGFDIVRGDKHPKGVYHKVVQVFTFNQNGQLLVTLRHPDKIFGLFWEITAGSVLKGETELQGAVRELEEETGITVAQNELHLLHTLTETDALWYVYWVKTTVNEDEIRYQEGETIDHRWIDALEFLRLLDEGAFPPPMKERLLEHWDNVRQTLKDKVGFVL